MTQVVAHRLVRETLLALMVLALSFLNFGHTNVAFAAGGRLVLTTTSFCGNPLMPADGDHVSCHACRIGSAADLPPVPCDAIAVAFAAIPVVYADPHLAAIRLPLPIVAQPRAPPRAG